MKRAITRTKKGGEPSAIHFVSERTESKDGERERERGGRKPFNSRRRAEEEIDLGYRFPCGGGVILSLAGGGGLQ